ncbi:MAG: polymerase sigma factor FliA [Blastocatellia bacterium]
MIEDKRSLWESYGQGDITGRKELILAYVPLVKTLAKRIARIAPWADWEDLMQEGVIGLMKAMEKFDPGLGVPFKFFARRYILGAIFDSSELTRELARQQEVICRKIRRAKDELTKSLQRNPTMAEVVEKTGLTVEQINNALDAMSVAFAEGFPDTEEPTALSGVQTAGQERAAMIYEALAHLNEREQGIIRFYYWEDLPDKEIAARLGLTVSSVTKTRQRAIDRLRKRLDVSKQSSSLRRSRKRFGTKKKGGQDEGRRSGK